MFDLVLAGGTVVDGTGAPGYRADVGVSGETIAAIGDLGRAEARRVIDAAGLIVAPGFVDTHTHAEGALLVDPQHAMGLRQGITTEFLGIDGMSYAPLSPANYRLYRRWLAGLLGEPPEDLDMSSVAAFRRHYHRKVAVNTAYLVPFATVRLEVAGIPRRAAPRARSWTQARRLVREGLEQGAVGFSTGSKYYPGPWGDTAELIALCEPVAAAGARLHVRAAPGAARARPRRRRRRGGARGRAAQPACGSTSPTTGRRRRRPAGSTRSWRRIDPAKAEGARRHLRHLPVPVGQLHRR